MSLPYVDLLLFFTTFISILSFTSIIADHGEYDYHEYIVNDSDDTSSKTSRTLVDLYLKYFVAGYETTSSTSKLVAFLYF